ncbi:MAG: V-type ATPase 116kDa subunit family protein [candidate division WOR-3 bacterium]
MATLRMKKVEIIGEKERLDKFLRKLQELSVLHIEDKELEESIEFIKPAISEKEKEILKKIDRAIGMIEEIRKEEMISSHKIEKREFKDIEDLFNNLEEIYLKYKKIKEEEKKLIEERNLYFSFTKILEVFEELIEKEEIHIPENFEVKGFLLPREELILLSRIKENFEKDYGEKVKIFERVIKGNQIAILIIYSPEIKDELRERLWREGLPEISLPEDIGKLSFKEMLKFLRNKLEEIPKKFKENELRKKIFIDKNLNILFNSFYILQDIRDLLKIKEKGIFVTRYFFYLEGFLPEKDIESLREIVKEENVYLKETNPMKEEYKRVPVILKNPSFFKNFEPFIEFFSLPVYRTFDPTSVLAIFFPVYFGFMLGDIGYGFLSFLLFLLLYLKFNKNEFIKRISFAYILASIFTILFGLLYMEMFGDLLEKIGFKPIFHRVHDANTYLLIAISFGSFQVILGFILGIYNALNLGHGKHAIGVFSMLLGLLSLLLLAGTSLKILPDYLSSILLIFLFLFMIMSFKFHGPAAPIEIFSAFGHILSFARLMAIGLSSAIIAVIANKFVSILPSIIIGILVMFLFHVLAFILGIFDPTIQGLRLQFVEFFTKFYEAGGREYKPLFKRLKGVPLPEIK